MSAFDPLAFDPAAFDAGAAVTPEPEAPVRGGGGYHSLPSTSAETREAVLRAYEAAEAAQRQDISADIPAQPEALKPAPRKADRPVKRRDISADIAATAANAAMAEALAKVSDGLAKMQARRLLDDEEEAVALILILAEA